MRRNGAAPSWLGYFAITFQERDWEQGCSTPTTSSGIIVTVFAERECLMGRLALLSAQVNDHKEIKHNVIYMIFHIWVEGSKNSYEHRE